MAGARHKAVLAAITALAAGALLTSCEELDNASTSDGTQPAAGNGPGERSARVTHIADGDTITLSGLGKTRLIGVDTPEVYGGAECYGKEASAFTKRLLPLGTRVTYTLGIEPRDRYNRALAYVWKQNGAMVNLTLAKKGYAVQLTIPPNVEYERKIRAAVRDAREHERGLWAASTCAGDADERITKPGETPTPAPEQFKRCSDFTTQANAQRYFEAHPSAPMDGDRDGRACETLP